MRSLLCLLAGIVFSTTLSSQSRNLPLNFKSSAIKLCVSKDESFVMTTKVGEIGLAESINSTWRRTRPKEGEELFGLTLEQPSFFNRDTGFVSGHIDSDGDYDIIYHTTDGGKKWTGIDFGEGGWVDDACNLDNGEAWLSVAGSGIAYTSDFGFTWEKLKIPEIKQRFTNIFFNGQHQGIIGSLWNLLAYTENNCKTWKLLPTPLDQKTYAKTNTQSRPAFDRVAIVNELLLVKQEGLVFYSKKDTIQWKWLKEYNDFYTDHDNTAIYFHTTKGSIVRADTKLDPIFDFRQLINGHDTKCKNGSLFIVSKDRMYKLGGNNTVNSYLFATNESSNIEPAYIGYCNNGYIGVAQNKAYAQKDYNGNWQYIFDFPFAVDSGKLSINEYNLIIYDRNDDSLFYIDLYGKEVMRRSKTKLLSDFAKEGIKEIRFDKGSQGCFHYDNAVLTYVNRIGTFISQGTELSNPKHSKGLPSNDEKIDEQKINAFVSKITSLPNNANQVSIRELAFSEMEYQQCKKDILEFKESLQSTKKRKETKFALNVNNIDFERLVSLVDSVKLLDRGRLNQIFLKPDDFFSTTVYWSGFNLVNKRNQTLSVTSRNYGSNAFYFPWIVHLDGYSFITTNIEINKFIESVYPSFLQTTDRIAVLHNLVKELY